MKKSLFYACSFSLLILLAAACSDSGQDAQSEPSDQAVQTSTLPEPELDGYSRGFALRDMRFLWTLNEDSLDVKLVAKTTGWVGIGFNPDEPENMKAASFIIGFVRGGKAEAADHYGTELKKHKDDEQIGGKSDFSNFSGSEENGQTELSFTVPLDSGDPMDKPISAQGDNTILLAYGKSDRIVLKHKFRSILKVNLSTGENSVLLAK
jgi:hypothetical protein